MNSDVHADPNTVAIEPTAEPKNIWAIMAGVFTAPLKAFEAFNVKPKIIIPLIVILILSGTTAVLMAPYQGRAQVDMMSKSKTIPPQYMEEMRNRAENVDLVQSFFTGMIPILLLSLVAALIAWFLGKVVFAGNAGFKATWGVAILASLISAVGGLLRIPLVMAKDSILVSYGLAALMPGKDFTSILYSLLYYCDIFMIWAVIAGGIGYAVIFGLTRGKGYLIAAVSDGILILVLLGLTIVGLSFAGVEISFL